MASKYARQLGKYGQGLSRTQGLLYLGCPWHAIALKQFLLNALLIAAESLERHFNGECDSQSQANSSDQRGVCAMFKLRLISALSECRPTPRTRPSKRWEFISERRNEMRNEKLPSKMEKLRLLGLTTDRASPRNSHFPLSLLLHCKLSCFINVGGKNHLHEPFASYFCCHLLTFYLPRPSVCVGLYVGVCVQTHT